MCVKMRHIKTIFIDIDDTLWNFEANSILSLQATCKRFLPNDAYSKHGSFMQNYEEYNLALWQLYNKGEVEKDVLMVQRFAQALESIGIKDNNWQIAEQMNDFYLHELVEHDILMPGAVELLQYLKEKGYEINTMSNGFKGIQERKLKAGGMDRYISHVILSEDCGITKPRPGIYEYAQKTCKCAPQGTVMIGDDPTTDILGAHNAGWKTIYLNIRKQDCAYADYTVTTLLDIKNIL